MSDPTKVSRGVSRSATLVAVKDRRWSEPIPDEFLSLFEAAGLIVDDNDHYVTAYRAGLKAGAVWGPAVPGYWFAASGDSGTVRVASRDDGLRRLLGLDVEQVAS
jgi:hypothetical protein